MDEDGDLQPASERWLTGHELHQLLASMPALKTLKANTWVFAKEEWQAMTRNESGRFPKLENLHFSRTFLRDEELIKPFIASHPIQHLALEGSLCTSVANDFAFTHYDIIQGEEEITDWLSANIPGFVLEVRDLDELERREPLEFRSDVWRLW
ncbi:hypothetical protein RSAG8_07465, partial [Rhizoctonia solani AG-8 WAC10335]